ncbi:hypothetical protein ACLX1H_000971 [Fusarium chlamydosporum]
MSLYDGKISPNQDAFVGPALSTPYNGRSAFSAFTISYSTTIKASAFTCVEKLINTNTWSTWNMLTPRATITERPAITEHTTNADELREVISKPGYLYKGVAFTVDVHMNPNSTTKTNTATECIDRVERFETKDGRLGYRVVWRYVGMPFWLCHNERVHEFVEHEDPKSGEKVTEYIDWETFGGLIAFIIKYTAYRHFVGTFQRWRNDFKAAVEITE